MASSKTRLSETACPSGRVLERPCPRGRDIQRFRDSLMSWGGGNLRLFPWRKNRPSNYKIVVSEILLQRTRAVVVAGFYQPYFRAYPSWNALANAQRPCLESDLKPIGLFKRRAVTLIDLAQVMVLRNGRFPADRADIEELPGVGQYVANAIELFVHGRPRPLLDVNTARLLERYFGPRKLADIRNDPYLQTLAQLVVADAPDPASLNWAMLDYAALVCRSGKPACDTCELSKRCRHALGKESPRSSAPTPRRKRDQLP